MLKEYIMSILCNHKKHVILIKQIGSCIFSLNTKILSDIMGMILNKMKLKGVVSFEGKGRSCFK